jgi:hypothetical protein
LVQKYLKPKTLIKKFKILFSGPKLILAQPSIAAQPVDSFFFVLFLHRPNPPF